MVRKDMVVIVFSIVFILLCSTVLASSFPYYAFNDNLFDFEQVGKEEIQKNEEKDVGSLNLIKPKVILKEEITPNIHKIDFTMSGIVPKNLTINVGDTIIWTNTRNYTKAMLQGSRQYLNIKSTLLGPDESFAYTFTIPDNYTFVDAVMKAFLFELEVVG